MCKRLTVSEIPSFSSFVQRTAQAIALEGEEEFSCVLERYSKKQFTYDDFAASLSEVTTCEALSCQMRRLRRDVLLSLALEDISGAIDYETVVSTMSALAEATIEKSVRLASLEEAKRYGIPQSEEGVPQDLIVLAMGKLGGRELNVSSDIDLVFVYDEGGVTKGPTSISNHEFFERVARRVIALLNRVEAEGFVFRVDTRLRPFGDSGPIVVSSAMLEDYLYREGRDWERFAWLKARIVSEPVFMSQEEFKRASETLRALVEPFVYRKYVDFGVLGSLSRVHEMIRTETRRRELKQQQGIHVKLGRGGIREIEFIVQTFQVMRGGRNRALRGSETLKKLKAVGEAGCLSAETVEKLSESYVFLRNLEHALQYVDDKQTHFLSNEKRVQEKIAAMLGTDADTLLSRLEETRDFVSSTFDSIFKTTSSSEEKEGWPIGWRLGDEAAKAAITEKLTELGFTKAEELSSRICGLLTARAIANQTEKRDQLAALFTYLAENARGWAAKEGSDTLTESLLERFLNLMEVIAGRTTYLALLNRYPTVTEKVARLLLSSRWASDFLCEHPILLDELVDARNAKEVDLSPTFSQHWEAETKEKLLSFAGDVEAMLNVLRDATHAATFQLLMADLEGRFTVEALADRLSELADAVLRLVLEFTWQITPSHHREAPRFAIIGYGKLGGKELSYESDLDLVFLYDDDAPEASEVYARLARRVISWLTMQTSSGKLYSVDTRLRPEGEDGLLVSSFEHFKQYEENKEKGAWIWEHQALTRARFCAGDAQLGARFEAERNFVLSEERDVAAVREAVVSMRERILKTHRNSSELFDLKRDRGGMVDVEFVVQTLVLTKATKYPSLLKNLGNSALLALASELGLIDKALANEAIHAYRTYRNIQRRVRLEFGSDAPVRVPLDSLAKEREAVLSLWKEVLGTDQPLA